MGLMPSIARTEDETEAAPVKQKPPKREPSRLFWYAERYDEYCRRPDWAWNGYQCLVCYCANYRKAFGSWGDYSIRRDEALLAQAKRSCDADGIELETAIQTYFERRKTDKWHQERGWCVPAFKSVLSGIKTAVKRATVGKAWRCPTEIRCVCSWFQAWCDEHDLPEDQIYCAANGLPFQYDKLGDQIVCGTCDGRQPR